MSQEDHLPTVAIITVLGVEFEALKQSFGFTESDRRPGGGNLYYEKRHTSLGGPVRLQLHIQGKAGNTDAAAEVMAVLHAARPGFMVLCGIAAGYRGKVKIGDVVVPRAVVDTTRKVAQDGRPLPRPEITTPQAAVIKMTAASAIKSNEWHNRFRQLAPDPLVRHTYPDGVIWVSLGEEPNLITELARCGRYLGSDSILGLPTVAEAADKLTKLLHGKRVLMVVDDVWDPGHAAPFRQAAPAGSAILVTTRLPAIADVLGPGPDGVYHLRVLDERHGLELLRALTGDVVAEHPGECLELVRVLECLPLALHVAGRLLAAEHRNGWGVGDLLADLRGPASQLLSAPAPMDRADPATSMIPTVEVLLRRSTDRLDSETRERFAWLGAFAPKPATFALDAMQAVWDVPDARPTVRELVARGLLEPAGSRFQMHALLVAHARGLCE